MATGQRSAGLALKVLAVQELGFGYPRRCIGADVSFQVAPGEVLCLLGPNGSGKTTLFKTVLGLLPPLAGQILVDGESTAHWSAGRRARVFGYVPQAQGGFFPYTLLETVLMGRTAHLSAFAQPGPRDRDIARQSLAALGLDALAERSIQQVSGGERQLALIARALAQEPRILVLDEPTASLDFGNQVRVLEEIRQLALRGMAVILSTHDPDHALALGHRVAMLKGGELVALGPPAEVLDGASLGALYGVAVEVVRLADGRRVCLPRLP